MFVPGKVYRRRVLHEKYGGQQQGGISTPRDHPIIFLFTGESGQQYGYADGPRSDGTFWYTGEGQVGDMPWVRGNAAIRDHEKNGKTLHLFEDAGRGHVRYVEEASCIGNHIEVAPDRDGNPRKAIVFELSLESQADGASRIDLRQPQRRDERRFWTESMEALRSLALSQVPRKATTKQKRTNVYNRSQAVRVYVLRRADGACEGCQRPAPFSTPTGTPYLEPHHIRRVADGGPDHPRWVAAVCPNCHRRVHYGEDGPAFNEEIAKHIGGLEQRR